jgi:hypothetical protein
MIGLLSRIAPPPSNSDVSGLPASSSEASSGKPHPVFQSFTWYLGVIDGQMLGRPSGPCMVDPCRHSPIREHRDDEPEDDGRGPAGQDWRRNINARGWPADDLPCSGTQGMCQRTRSPHGHHGGGRQCAGARQPAPEDHGCVVSRSPAHSSMGH